MNTAHKMQLRLKFLQSSSLLSVSHVEEKKEKKPPSPKPKHSEDFQIFQIGKRLLRKGDIFWKEYREDFHCTTPGAIRRGEGDCSRTDLTADGLCCRWYCKALQTGLALRTPSDSSDNLRSFT